MAFEIITTGPNGMTRHQPESVEAWAEAHGVAITGTQTNPRLRPELQGHPKMGGFCGPAWGGTTESGEAVIRYEDVATYAALSQ